MLTAEPFRLYFQPHRLQPFASLLCSYSTQTHLPTPWVSVESVCRSMNALRAESSELSKLYEDHVVFNNMRLHLL